MEKQLDTSSILLTPAPQASNSKRAREAYSYSAETTSDSKFKLMYTKKTKLNPLIEKEETIQTKIDIFIRDDAPTTLSEETPLPSISSAQIIQKQNSAEISSSSKPVEKEKNIMEK